MAQYNTLAEFTTDIANALREKTGGGQLISPQEFASRIRALPVLGDECDCLIFFNNTQPASKYGGSWQELTQGTFLMAAGSGNTASATVDNHGNPNGMHTMTVEQMAEHFHWQSYSVNAESGAYYTVNASWGHNIPLTQTADYTSTEGKSQPFDIRPPTVTAHIWRKTS